MISIRTWAIRTLIAGTVALASCGFKKTDSGVEYKVIEDKDGPKVEAGGFVEVTLNYTNEADTFKSSQQPRPVQIPIPDSITIPHSIESVLAMLSEGDSVIIRMSSDSLYKNIFRGDAPKGMEEDSKTTFEIRIVHAFSKDSLRKLKEQFVAQQKAQQEMMMMQMQMQAKADSVQITQYLKSKKIKAERTPDGVYYTISKKKDGFKLQPGDKVNAVYSGRLLDGTEFDSGTFPVEVGVTSVIRGWHSSLMALRMGEKGTFYIPSTLGYGPQGAPEGKIPPNAVLVFDIEATK